MDFTIEIARPVERVYALDWEFPTYENANTFVNRLVRARLLVRDPLVDEVMGIPRQTPSGSVGCFHAAQASALSGMSPQTKPHRTTS